MPLNSRLIADRVIAEFDEIGIRSRVGGKESETAALVRVICDKVVEAIRNEAIVTTTVVTAGSPTSHTGTGTGSIK